MTTTLQRHGTTAPPPAVRQVARLAPAPHTPWPDVRTVMQAAARPEEPEVEQPETEQPEVEQPEVEQPETESARAEHTPLRSPGETTVYSTRPVVNWAAVGSVLLGLVGLLGAPPTMGFLAIASVVAIGLGHAAQAQDEGPHRLATVGLVLGYLVTVPTVIAWLGLAVIAAMGAIVA